MRDHHAHRVATFAQAYRELRIVAPHSLGTDHDCVGRGAQLMHRPAAIEAGDPAGVSAGRRHLAVERHGGLVRRRRKTRLVVLDEGSVQLASPRPPLLRLRVDLHAAGAKAGKATAVDPRIGVAQRNHGARDTGRYQRRGAGRRAALMVARLKSAVEGGAAGARARLDGPDLRVGARRGPYGSRGPQPHRPSPARRPPADLDASVRDPCSASANASSMYLSSSIRNPRSKAPGQTTPRRRSLLLPSGL